MKENTLQPFIESGCQYYGNKKGIGRTSQTIGFYQFEFWIKYIFGDNLMALESFYTLLKEQHTAYHFNLKHLTFLTTLSARRWMKLTIWRKNFEKTLHFHFINEGKQNLQNTLSVNLKSQRECWDGWDASESWDASEYWDVSERSLNTKYDVFSNGSRQRHRAT